jgi:arylformamidase
MSEPEYRAQFDARVEFVNGGHLDVTDFRIDVPHAAVTPDEVADLFVASLGLLMTGRVTVASMSVIAEAHKGTRGGPADAAADRTGERRLVELSHVIVPGLITYPGLPGPEVTPVLTRADSRTRYAPGTEFAIDRISLVGNTGTYLDAPFHRYADGAALSDLPLDRLADLPAVVVRTLGSDVRGIDVGVLAAHDVRDRAVLLHTGGDQHFGRPEYAVDAPFLTAAGAQWLVEHGATLVGIDSVNIDDVDDGSRPAHSILLAAGIPVVEHLTGLAQVPPHGARFTAAPPRLDQFGTFPVRAFAVL